MKADLLPLPDRAYWSLLMCSSQLSSLTHKSFRIFLGCPQPCPQAPSSIGNLLADERISESTV